MEQELTTPQPVDGPKADPYTSRAIGWALRAEYEQLNQRLEHLRNKASHLSKRRDEALLSFHAFDILPIEIIAEILALASSMGSSLEKYEFPATNQLVCRRWRQILRQTPRVWTHFDNTSSSKHHAFASRIRKAGALPLDIMVTVMDIDHLALVLKPFLPAASRWQSLAIELGRTVVVPEIMELLPTGLHNLENLAISQPRTASLSTILFSPAFPNMSIPDSPFPLGQVRKLHLYYSPLVFGPAVYRGGLIEELVVHGWHWDRRAGAVEAFVGALDGLTNLKHLDISGPPHYYDPPPLHSSQRGRVNLPRLDSLTLRSLPHPIALHIICSLNALRLSFLALDRLYWEMEDAEPQDTSVGWDFPHLSTIHLLQMTRMPELWVYFLSTLTAVNHLKFTGSRILGGLDVFAPLFGPSLSRAFGENLVSLITRRVWLPSLRYYVRNLAPQLRYLRVHVEDLTMAHGVDRSVARRLEEEVRELRREIAFETDYVYDEDDDFVPLEMRFKNWGDREECGLSQ